RSCILRSFLGKSLRPRKDDFAAKKRAVVLGSEPGHRRARIARKLTGSVGAASRKDIACQRLLKGPRVRRIEGCKVGGLPGVKDFGKGQHPLRYGEGAHAHF